VRVRPKNEEMEAGQDIKAITDEEKGTIELMDPTGHPACYKYAAPTALTRLPLLRFWCWLLATSLFNVGQL